MSKITYIPKTLYQGKLIELELKTLIDGDLTDLEIATYTEPPEPILGVEVGAYTTWFDDPSTSVMIHYQTVDSTPVECLVREEGSTEWQTIELFADKPFPNTSKRVRWFKLDGLTPNTTYETRLRYHETVHRFKTMPSTFQRSIKVAMVSDQINSEPNFRTEAPRGFQTMYNNNIDALIIAGDLVHDDGWRTSAWTTFWDEYFKAERSNNLLLPMIACLGNHDGRDTNPDNTTKNLLWYNLGARRSSVVFAFNFFSNIAEESYGVIDITDYMSFVYLDSGHTQPIQGDQTTWLENTLSARQGRQIFTFFHVSPYPAYYSYAETVGVRSNWTPILAQYGIKLAGSGHEHVHLVTKHVIGDNLDPSGTIFTGQGHGMGNNTRGLNITEDEWYVDFLSIAEKGFDIMEFRQNGEVYLKKVNLDGGVLFDLTL